MLDKENKPLKEVKEIEVKEAKVISNATKHTVLKQITLEKVYNIGSTIELSNEELKKELLTKKFIANGISRSN